MSVSDFKSKINKMNDALANLQKHGGKDTKGIRKFYDFKTNKASYYKGLVDSTFIELKKTLFSLDDQDENTTMEMMLLIKELEKSISDFKKASGILSEMASLSLKLKETKTKNLRITYPKLPVQIKDEVIADLKEMEKCFNAGCYRSSTILCGRVLETILHRKYYEVTGRDILETNPGIGLGTLVAKLSEKKVMFDPGITQQIHLINQVRISSVHKKQSTFNPSRSQAYAMMLYTLDIINKIF